MHSLPIIPLFATASFPFRQFVRTQSRQTQGEGRQAQPRGSDRNQYVAGVLGSGALGQTQHIKLLAFQRLLLQHHGQLKQWFIIDMAGHRRACVYGQRAP